MGGRSKRTPNGKPDRIYSGYVESESTNKGGSQGVADEDCIEIQLVQVDAVVQSATRVCDDVWVVNDSQVLALNGRLGDIPHSLISVVKRRCLGSGKVLRINVPTVRLCQ
jgi:hypothetical protein